eukprot:scaffold106588_cov63-Phaeocystis_antarctica.AAC.2
MPTTANATRLFLRSVPLSHAPVHCARALRRVVWGSFSFARAHHRGLHAARRVGEKFVSSTAIGPRTPRKRWANATANNE